MAKNYWIVWNQARTEGFVTDDRSDARQASTGDFRGAYSALGSSFFEINADDAERPVQRIEINKF